MRCVIGWFEELKFMTAQKQYTLNKEYLNLKFDKQISN